MLHLSVDGLREIAAAGRAPELAGYEVYEPYGTRLLRMIAHLRAGGAPSIDALHRTQALLRELATSSIEQNTPEFILMGEPAMGAKVYCIPMVWTGSCREYVVREYVVVAFTICGGKAEAIRRRASMLRVVNEH